MESFYDIISNDTIVIFTDGSCYPNPDGVGGWGWVGLYKEWVNEAFGNIPKPCTSNQAELTAILMALRTIKFADPNWLIITDSKYCYNCLNSWARTWSKFNWETATGATVANKEIISECWDILSDKGELNWRVQWMKGHQAPSSGPYAQFNDTAHTLAHRGRLLGG